MKKILVIDDEKTVCLLTKLNLEFKGKFSVDTVNSGISGLKALEANKYDLVLLDYMMPGMKGDEVLKIIKSKYSSIPVVFYSVYYDDNSIVNKELIKLADKIVNKPITNKALYSIIDSMLS